MQLSMIFIRYFQGNVPKLRGEIRLFINSCFSYKVRVIWLKNVFDTPLLFEYHQKTRAYQHDQNISPKINMLRAKGSCYRFAGTNKRAQLVFNNTEIENTSSRGKCPKKMIWARLVACQKWNE